MGGEVLRVCVTGMQHDMYIARVDIQKGRTLLEIDARPSDAVALALRCGVAVYCDDVLLKNQRVPYTAKESALTGALRKEEPHYIDRAQQNKYGRYKM
jgi:bifunctional DNase/RNase